MKTVTDSFRLRCTPEAYWRVLLDEAYVRALYLDGLGFKGVRVLSVDDGSRKIFCEPKLNLPGPLQKLIGSTFAYEEHGTLDRARGEWTWRMLQPAGPDGTRKSSIVTTRGKTRVVAEGEDACRRHDEVVVEAHVFGLGGLIEATVEKEVRSGWAKEVAFLERWLAKLG